MIFTGWSWKTKKNHIKHKSRWIVTVNNDTDLNTIYGGLKSVLDEVESELDHDIVQEGQAGTDNGWSQEIPDDIFDDSPNFLVYQIKLREAQQQALEGKNNGNG